MGLSFLCEMFVLPNSLSHLLEALVLHLPQKRVVGDHLVDSKGDHLGQDFFITWGRIRILNCIGQDQVSLTATSVSRILRWTRAGQDAFPVLGLLCEETCEVYGDCANALNFPTFYLFERRARPLCDVVVPRTLSDASLGQLEPRLIMIMKVSTCGDFGGGNHKQEYHFQMFLHR